ncbi:MAG: hemerythrin domain-containing protein [Actinomycetota bacterium]|nr:hemerythrin domain-containing protein [Actinomycetota bacterium]
MTDVTQLILDDHETFRSRFAELDDLRADATRAGPVWDALARLLEVHASAEEEHFYPALLQHVKGSEDETKDAIGDHDDIRAGIRKTADAEVGSDDWWQGIEEVREANDEHMQEEEHDGLPDFRRAASAELRDEVGARFERFKADHAALQGLSGEDKDPDRFVRENR